MIEKQVRKTLEEIKLPKNKKILVALSGGKDSASTAFLLKELGYNVEGLYVDLCVGDYSKNCLKKIEELCERLNIKFHVYDLKKEQKHSMFDVWKKNKVLNHCAACGVMKKWVLNKKARELGFNVIATGHNLDDEAQTFLMNILKGAPELSISIGAATKNATDDKKKFITRVKPLFYVREEDVLKFAKKNKLPFIRGKCPHAEESYRIELREWMNKNLSRKEKENLIKNFEKLQPKIQKTKYSRFNYCVVCGEPSRGKVCKKCGLI